MDSWKMNVRFALVLVLVVFASCDESKDKEECAESLVGLATCLPYVGGTAKAPTPDCCSGLKQVLNTNKKCLCVIIKDRNDPDLGLNINATLALALPQVCNAPANVSQCPALLKLAPNSPEAQVFNQVGQKSDNSGIPVGGSNDNVKPNPTSSGDEQKSGGSYNGNTNLGLKSTCVLLFLWSFPTNLII